MKTRPSHPCQTIRANSGDLLSDCATTNSKRFVATTSMLANQFTRFTNGTSPAQTAVPLQPFNASTPEQKRSSTRNALEHLSVGREFFHEHQETLNGFLRFVTSQAAPDEIDLFQFPRLQQEFFTACSGQKDVNGRINALIAAFSVQDHFHVPGPFELLKDQFIHTAAGFDQRRGDNC